MRLSRTARAYHGALVCLITTACNSSGQSTAIRQGATDGAIDVSVPPQAGGGDSGDDASNLESIDGHAGPPSREAGMITRADAASLERPMSGASIACSPDELCEGGHICCVSDTAGNYPKNTPPTYGTEVLGCQLPDGPCPETGLERYSLTCDGPEDCPATEVCCADYEAWVWTGLVFYDLTASVMVQEMRGARCRATCDEQILCHDTATCSSTESCVSPSELAASDYERSQIWPPTINDYNPLPYRMCAETAVRDAGPDAKP